MAKIVTIGGGTGQYTLLSGLATYPDLELTAICPISDSGGNTGQYLGKKLRPLVGERGQLLPPGDIGKCLLALSSPVLQERLMHRVKGVKELENYNAINALLVAFWQLTGDFLKAIAAVSEILASVGQVLPVALARANLVADLANGQKIKGEEAIYNRLNCYQGRCLAAPIKKLYLQPSSLGPLPSVLRAIGQAGLVVIGPGCLPSSIISTLLVPGITSALKKTKAKKVYLANVMAHFGEQPDFKLSSFVLELEKYLGFKVDTIVANTERPADSVLQKYWRQDKAKMVKIDLAKNWQGRQIITAPLLVKSTSVQFKDYARHDAAKLAKLVKSLI
ncbi:MAG: gluconeogenesis factor YvcK family protein [Patescibacteria group bacterium]